MKQAKALTELLIQQIFEKIPDENYSDEKFTLAISGGSSPKNLFSLWRDQYRNSIPWEKIELFWVDERCVPLSDRDSNFGMTKAELLDSVSIPDLQIHRIKGEDDPGLESARYSKLVLELLPVENGVPIFDFIVLGIGEDGHTSSIFPGQEYLLNHRDPYAPSVNPYNRQKRVAMTGLPIIKARIAAYYLTGVSKTAIMDSIYKFPAGYLLKNGKNMKIFWDK
ncbi:MAG: 6-phosphogluconolactonase [Bacteroidales bacterium]